MEATNDNSSFKFLCPHCSQSLEATRELIGNSLECPPGSTFSEKEFLVKHADIRRRLRKGQSVRNAAKITGKGISTVQRVKKVLTAKLALPQNDSLHNLLTIPNSP